MSLVKREGVESRELIHDNDKCVGCGICTDICPTESLRLGPIVPIARGLLKMDYISCNSKNCVLCGLCASACPFDALSLKIDDEFISNIENYPVWHNGAEINEEDYSEKYVKITMYTSSSISLSFKIETEEYSTNVKLSATNINIVFVPVTEESDVTSETINLSKNSTASSVSYELSISTEGENAANIIITMDLTGIATDDVTEKYNIEFNEEKTDLEYRKLLNKEETSKLYELANKIDGISTKKVSQRSK